jgi:hypothetical protein
MNLNLLFKTPTCGGSNCPSVYETDRGTLAVQGWDLPAGTIETPAGEGIVEIPADVEAEIGRRWARREGLI